MLPFLIVTKNPAKFDEFIDKLIQKDHYSPVSTYHIRPPKDEIVINQVRQLKRELIIHQSNKRLVVFYQFDRSSLEAQNALLKVLEESTENNQFILFTKNSEKVIPTIRSRAKIINLDKTAEPIIIEQKYIKFFDSVIESSDAGFLSNMLINGLTKEEAILFFYKMTEYFRNKLLSNKKESKIIIKIIKKTFYLIGLLESNNLNVQLTIDNLLIFIWKSFNMKFNET